MDDYWNIVYVLNPIIKYCNPSFARNRWYSYQQRPFPKLLVYNHFAGYIGI